MPVVYIANTPILYHAYVNSSSEDVVRNGWKGYTIRGTTVDMNIIHGGRGNDTIYAYGWCVNNITGGDGADKIYIRGIPVAGRPFDTTARGGNGNDTIDASFTWGPTKLFGDAGDDRISGGSGNDTIDGGAGKDIINDFGSQGTVRGGEGDDVITTRFNTGMIYGDGGNDVINIDRDRFDLNGAYLYLDDGPGHDTVTVGHYANHMRATSSPGWDTFNLSPDRTDFSMTYLFASDSVGNRPDTMNHFGPSDAIYLNQLHVDRGVQLRWSNNSRGLGNVFIENDHQNRTADLWVNAVVNEGMLHVHFTNIEGGLTRDQIFWV